MIRYSSLRLNTVGKQTAVGMGDEAGGDKGIHVARVGAQLQIGHVGGDLGRFGNGIVAHDHGVRAGQGGIADVLEPSQLHVREHTDVHGVFHIDAAADAAGDIHPVNAFGGHVHGLEQRVNGGENSALGPDEVVDVHLVDGHLPAGFRFLCRGDNIAAHAVGVPLNAAALPDEQALGVDDPAAVQLGDDIDDAGAADAHGLLTGIAYDGQGRLHGGVVNGTGFDGTVGGAHTAGDVAALKGGSGGAGAAHVPQA